mmetsp:Transcript_36905/g.114866  ORF Transcript_36905/g.114866 Transcript_36905/m.114866 type:complete len:217 (+) Transcript_36905:143-793(+)
MRRRTVVAVSAAAAMTAAAAAASAGRVWPAWKAPPCQLLGSGSLAGWQFGAWRPVTDAVRGGVSSASLRPHPEGAEFSGSLDPSKLRAGFAGMSLPASALPEALERFAGLGVDVAACDGFEYSVLLKVRGAASGASHQFKFRPLAPGRLLMPYGDFKPILRGRAAPQLPPLDLKEVESLSLQISSNFCEQSGSFSLVLRSIEGLPELPPARAETAP